MSDPRHVSANRAYRKGLWNVMVWPIVINLLIVGGLVWAIISAILPIEIALIIVGSTVLISWIWSFRSRGKWKLWMVEHSANPKTSLELARSSFLKSNRVLWSSSQKNQFSEAYEARMKDIRAQYLASASEKYADKHSVNVTYKFSGLLWILLFEVLVMTGLVFLFMNQADVTLKGIISVLLVLSTIGFIYTLRTIWARNTTVLEITKHGIRIEETFIGWLELEHIDIVGESVLEYKKFNADQEKYILKNLSLSGEYLDELILFYWEQSKSTTEV